MNNEKEVKEVLKQIETEGEKKQSSQKNNSPYKSWWFWTIIIIVLLAAIYNSYNKNTNTVASSNVTSNVTNNKDNTLNKSTNTSVKTEKAKVTVIDFSQMSKEEIRNWCNENKVSCTITEEYSDTVPKGDFVSQSAKANSIIYERERITVIYSLGKEPTMGEKNALKKGKEYLRVMPFSYRGLVKQLEYEGFSKEEATYGADNCGADWNEQAVQKAKDYMNTMSFSRNGLIKQLEYEGFTNPQAEYGVSAVGY